MTLLKGTVQFIVILPIFWTYGHFPDISRAFPGHFAVISRTFCGYFPDVLRLFPGHFPDVFRTFFKKKIADVFRTFFGSFPDVSRTFPGHFLLGRNGVDSIWNRVDSIWNCFIGEPGINFCAEFLVNFHG